MNGKRLRRNGYRTGLLVGLLLHTQPIPSAMAHPQSSLTTVNRYARLLVTGGRVRVFYTLMVGELPALALRNAADRDGTGGLDPAEQSALAMQLREQISEGVLLISSGSKPVRLTWEPPVWTALEPQTGAAAFSIDVNAQAALRGDEVGELLYEDRVAVSPVGEVELRIEEAPDVRLLGARLSSQAASSVPAQLLFAKTGADFSSQQDTAIHLEYAKAEPPSKAKPRFWRVPVVIGAGLCLLVALLGVTRIFRMWRTRLR